jgi:TetR/AcrR family transcriptional repressor of nem operon
MARPKQFDPEEAMQEAMEAFWENGYSATSVHDLLEEMGLNRGSLYGTFGDKKKLFLAVLDKYDQQRVEDFRRILEEPESAELALRNLFNRVVEECTSEGAGRGCLAAKAAMELAPHDKDVAAWLRKFHRRNVSMVAKVIERGQKRGEISRGVCADVAAKFVLNNIAGLRLLGAMTPSSNEVRQVMEMVLDTLIGR